MSDWREGDLVEATKGETVIRGRLQASGYDNPDLVLTLALRSDPLHLIANGFEVTVIERGPDPLPVAPGYYADKNGGVWQVSAHGYLAVDVKGSAGWFTGDHLQQFAPFTRLRPEREVAADVIESVRENAVQFFALGDVRISQLKALDEIASEYGLSEWMTS